MTRRGFIGKCLGVAAAMLLPAAEAFGQKPAANWYRKRVTWEGPVDGLPNVFCSIVWEERGGMVLDGDWMTALLKDSNELCKRLEDGKTVAHGIFE